MFGVCVIQKHARYVVYTIIAAEDMFNRETIKLIFEIMLEQIQKCSGPNRLNLDCNPGPPHVAPSVLNHWTTEIVLEYYVGRNTTVHDCIIVLRRIL